jgi:hypothetical protein
MKQLTEAMAIATLLATLDVRASAEVGGFTSVRDARRFVVAVKIAAARFEQEVSVQLLQAKDAAGTDAKELGDPIEEIYDADEVPDDVLVELRNEELDVANGFTYVGVSVVIDGDPDAGVLETCIIAPRDVGTADITGAYVDVSDCKRFSVLAKAGAVTAAKELTVQLMQATDDEGADEKVLGDPVVVAGVGGNAPADVVIEKLASDRDVEGGFDFVTATLGIDENAKLGCAWLTKPGRSVSATSFLVLGDRRYAP